MSLMGKINLIAIYDGFQNMCEYRIIRRHYVVIYQFLCFSSFNQKRPIEFIRRSTS